MRAVLAFVAILFCAALACAEPAKEEIVDEADALRVQLAETRAEELAAKIEVARRDLEKLRAAADAERAALQKKYKLGEGDGIDPKTRKIARAPKKDVKK